METIRIFDMEADGLHPTKIHCLAYTDNGSISDEVDYESIKKILLSSDVLIGHNIIRFDIVHLERLLGIKVKARLVDTLALSWYLYPNRYLHGLEHWGKDLGVAKPEITDWHNLSQEEYIHRCREDVKINSLLWEKMWNYLMEIYGDNEKQIWKLIEYLSFKMDCAREQEQEKWEVDIPYAIAELRALEEEKANKEETLKKVMPLVPVTAVRNRPKVMYKKDGSLSSLGASWLQFLEESGLPEGTESVTYTSGYVEGNPNSPDQKKDWLFSLGWKPKTFKYVKDGNKLREIPQIMKERGEGICDSVVELYEKVPELEALDGLSILQHRIGVLKSILECANKDGFVEARVAGFTNTLRFTHTKPLVNLPKPENLYAKPIRSCLIASGDYELCGSDMSSLEDRLKQHYMYPFDPDYVNEMNVEGFDPHLDLAHVAGAITKEDIEAYKNGDHSKKKVRSIFKNGNYACQYGAGPPRLVITCGIDLESAQELHRKYWERNKAVKEAAAAQTVKTVGEQMWLKNPVNGFYYSLRFEKDIFSTLVQGTASYVFDMWTGFIRKRGIKIIGQFHDENISRNKKEDREKVRQIYRNAIDKTNAILKLNRELDIGIDFGEKYSEIH